MKYIILFIIMLLCGAVLEVQGSASSSIEASKRVVNISDQSATYQISVKNINDESFISNITIEDILPNGFYANSSKYLNSNRPIQIAEFENNTDGTTKRIVWDLGYLQETQEKVIELVVTFEKGADIYSNQARIKGDILGIPSINLTIDANEKETPIGPSLEVDLKDIRDSNNNTRAMTYIIEVNNSGETTLKNVSVIDALPANISYIESSCVRAMRKDPTGNLIFEHDICPPRFRDLKKDGTNVTWNLGKFMPDEVAKINVVVEAREGAVDPQKVQVRASGDFLNRTYSTNFNNGVNWTEYTSNMVSQNPIKSASAKSSSKLKPPIHPIEAKKYLISIKDVEKNMKVVTYLIDIKNVEETQLKNVKVTAALIANASFINSNCQRAKQFSSTGKTIFKPTTCDVSLISINTEGRTNVTWNLGILVPNESFRIRFAIEIREGALGPLDNQVYATGES